MYWETLDAFRLYRLLQEGVIVLGLGAAMNVSKMVFGRDVVVITRREVKNVPNVVLFLNIPTLLAMIII